MGMLTDRYQRVKNARNNITIMAAAAASSGASATDNSLLLAKKLACLSGILVLGTITTLDTKLIFSTESEDSVGDVKKFAKPWFAVLMMFIGMSMSLPLWFGTNVLLPRLQASKESKAIKHLSGAAGAGDAISGAVFDTRGEALLSGAQNSNKEEQQLGDL